MFTPSRVLCRAGWALLVVIAAGLAGCETPRTAPDPLPSWNDPMATLFQERCVQCHGGQNPEGRYALDSYEGALGSGTDEVPNAIAGNPESRILTILSEEDHAIWLSGDAEERDALRERVRRWVVDAELAFFFSEFHGPGIQNPHSEEFHGELVEDEGWTMSSCRQCHGEVYTGGIYDVGCTECHTNTPESCDTCHGTGGLGAPPPPVYEGHDAGAHEAHLTSSARFLAVECQTCHLIPERFTAPGHVDNAGDRQAEVALAGLALAQGAEPVWSPSGQSCRSTYCHGYFPGANAPAPNWNEPAGIGQSCSACHGFPPSLMVNGGSHPDIEQCSLCHPTSGAGEVILQPALHLNGQTDTLIPEDCAACHSAPGEPMPFRDLTGVETEGEGAHAEHAGPTEFHAEQGGTTGYDCGVCHVVPATTMTPRHLNGQIDFSFKRPAVVGTLRPTWTPETATCQNTWCHGAGVAGGALESPPWNEPGDQVQCGTCHPLPPPNEPHSAATGSNCDFCHPTIGPNLQFIDLAGHVNGQVEAR